MGWSDDVVTTYLDKDTLLPAIGQGALGIECRSNDIELLELLQKFTIMKLQIVYRPNEHFSCNGWKLSSSNWWICEL